MCLFWLGGERPDDSSRGAKGSILIFIDDSTLVSEFDIYTNCILRSDSFKEDPFIYQSFRF